MLIKTPKFWLKKGLLAFLLWPVSLVYGFLFWIKGVFAARFKDVGLPVICVGNVTVGGSGKTPVAIALGKILRERRVKFAYLSRGYGAFVGSGSCGKTVSCRGNLLYSLYSNAIQHFSNRGGSCDRLQSDSYKVKKVEIGDDAKEVGDEPLLLREMAPVFIAKDRVKGAKAIKDYGFDLIIMDDGMQNYSLKKDSVVMVVDGKIGFGNGFLFPAGPLRQSVKGGLSLADLVVIIGKASDKIKSKIKGVDFVEAEFNATNLDEFRQGKFLAFCGIAYPQKFFSFLQESGVNVVEEVGFADHYFYKDEDLTDLLTKANDLGAQLVTTKKDWVRLDKKFRDKVKVLDVEVKFKGEEINKILK